MTAPLDLLFVAAHPDDAEILCGGSLIKSKQAGHRTGVLDLTRGEMGSAGTPEVRAREAARAAEIMGLNVRMSLGLADAFLAVDDQSKRQVVRALRMLRPSTVVTHWSQGDHPDHDAAHRLVRASCFLAGLGKIEIEGTTVFRPDRLLFSVSFAENRPTPSIVVDISDQIEDKLRAVAAYSSQTGGKFGLGDVRPAGRRALLEQMRFWHGRDGAKIGVRYGEVFWSKEAIVAGTLPSAPVASAATRRESGPA